MNRRTLLKLAATSSLLAAGMPHTRSSADPASALTGTTTRRVRPSDPSWPSLAEWEGLIGRSAGASSRSSRRWRPVLTNPTHRLAKSCCVICATRSLSATSPGERKHGWADAWMSAPSVYAVAAKTAGDVAAAVDFAREHNLRLVVKGGGHSYLGTSNAPDSLLIWTRAMDEIVLHDGFVPQGCSAPPLPAVSVGAGAIWLHVYDAVTTKAGRYVQGGGCTTVGVAGLVQSGGFGSFSKNYGTAAASLLEAEVVTADGAVRIANACTNPDLFWALKGGGGGSFGVVTRLTLKTHELAERAGAAIFTVKAMSGPAFRALIRKFVAFYAERLFNPHWGGRISFQRNETLSVGMVSYGLDKAAAQAVWQPFLDWIAAAPQDYRLTRKPTIADMPARNWWDAEFRKKYTADAIISDPRPGANPAIFRGPATTIRSARSGAASRRCGCRRRCSRATSSSDLPTRYTMPAGIGVSRSSSTKDWRARRTMRSRRRATPRPTRPCSPPLAWRLSAASARPPIPASRAMRRTLPRRAARPR